MSNDIEIIENDITDTAHGMVHMSDEDKTMENMTTKAAIMSACGTLRENNAERTPHKLVTYADWEAAGSFEKAASPGDYVEERIVNEMRDCLPPACMNFGFLQMGEPYSHELDPDTGKWKPTFATFKKNGQHWTYCGNCFYKQDTPPMSDMHRGL